MHAHPHTPIFIPQAVKWLPAPWLMIYLQLQTRRDTHIKDGTKLCFPKISSIAELSQPHVPQPRVPQSRCNCIQETREPSEVLWLSLSYIRFGRNLAFSFKTERRTKLSLSHTPSDELPYTWLSPALGHMRLNWPGASTDLVRGRRMEHLSLVLASKDSFLVTESEEDSVLFLPRSSSSHHLLNRKIFWAVVTTRSKYKDIPLKIREKDYFFPPLNYYFIPSAAQCILQSALHMVIKLHNIPHL